MKKFLLLASSLLAVGNMHTVYGEDTTTTESTNIIEKEERSDKDPYDMTSYDTVYETDMYKIGTDMPAGEYKLLAIDTFASYRLTGDARGEEYIASEYVDTFTYVLVEDGQYLELADCFAVPIEDAWVIKTEDNTLGPGTYKVGVDLEPGEYKVKALEGYSSFHISSDVNGNDHIDSDTIRKSNYLEVKEGEYLRLKNAELILK